MTRFERAFGILLLLSDGSAVTASALARRFEVSVRTIYRDVEMLSASGVPVYAERGSAGGYRLLEGYFLPPVAFRRYEIVAILLGLTLVRSLKVPPFAEELDSAERKLVAVLPSRLRPLHGATRRLIGFERTAVDAFHRELPPETAAPTSAGEARTVETFLKAVLDGTRVRFLYRTPYRAAAARSPGSGPVEAEPLGLLWDRDLWYLIGNRLDGNGRRARRFWRADRVAEIEASTFHSAASPEFDVHQHLGRRWLGEAMVAWGRSSPVRIRVGRALAERLRADWYFGFAEFAEDGTDGFVMTYGEADRSAVFELVRWLGPGAELIEPAAWRAELAAELRAMADAYR